MLNFTLLGVDNARLLLLTGPNDNNFIPTVHDFIPFVSDFIPNDITLSVAIARLLLLTGPYDFIPVVNYFIPNDKLLHPHRE